MNWAGTQYDLGRAIADRDSGEKYVSTEDDMSCHRAAFDVLRRLGDSGDSSAMRKLGFIYDNGSGIASDAVKVVELHARAADVCDTWAMSNLGNCYKRGPGWRRIWRKQRSFLGALLTLGRTRVSPNLARSSADFVHAGVSCKYCVCEERGDSVQDDAARAVTVFTATPMAMSGRRIRIESETRRNGGDYHTHIDNRRSAQNVG
jgi:TPR repeat protein